VLSSSEGGLSTSAAIAHLAERVAARLAGRGRGAARLEVTLSGASGDQVVPILPGVTSREDRPVPVSTLAAPSANRRIIDGTDELADAIGLAVDAEQAAPWRMRVTVTGEAIAGDAAATAVADALGTESLPDVAGTPLDVLGVVLASTGSARSLRSIDDPGGSWRLTPPGDPRAMREERRDAHRRTQRGKAAERRRVRDREFVQARLFSDRK